MSLPFDESRSREIPAADDASGDPTLDAASLATMRGFVWIAAIGAILLALCVLIGWLTDNAGLVGADASHAAMSPLTAISTLLAGLSLAARRRGQPGLAGLAAGAMLGIAGAVLASHAVAGEDRLNPLLGNVIHDGQGIVVGSMGLATASGMLLLALCLALLGTAGRAASRLLGWTSTGGLLLSGLDLLGYVYRVQDLYAVAFYRSTSLRSAAVLFTLFLACLAYRPDRGWASIIASGLPAGQVRRRLMLLSIVFPILAGLFVLRFVDVTPSLAVAIVVTSTMIPLVLRIMLDGTRLDELERARLAAEHEQAYLNVVLEERVRERGAALAANEAKLRQSQKMEAIGQLTGGIAHDFNNLLAGIIGSLDLVAKRLAQGRVDDATHYVEAAQGAALRGASLVSRLLSFGRRQTLDPSATDANDLVADMDELIRRTMGPAIAVRTQLAPGVWTIFVDANQFENALLNLCINARDAMPDGGTLTIETENRILEECDALEREVPAGAYVTLGVSDTGTGMTKAVAERAFDPFFTTKPAGVGSGLGLSMIHGFARQSGGQARIHSTPGEGTTVRLYFPRHERESEAAPLPPDMAVAAPAVDGECVLVIDDEETMRSLLRTHLEDLGYRVLTAGDGPAGLGILQAGERIDLLITDVGLPGGMNGRQVAEAARMMRPDLGVLFITGYAETAAIGSGTLAPRMKVLTKPFSLDRLGERVREMLTPG